MTSFPDPNVTPEFTGDNGITYSWDAIDGKWVVKRYAADFDDRYVNKEGGDSMQGPFHIEHNPNYTSVRDSRRISTLGLFSGSEGSALRLGTTRDRIYVSHNDTAFNGLVKIDEIGEKTANNGVKFKNNVLMGINQIKNLAEATDDKDAVNKEYVDDADESLRQDIIELEEEIEALAPTSERGSWTFNDVGVAGNPTQFTMYDADYGNGSVTGVVKNVKSIWFNAIDNDGTSHGFAGVNDGDLLQLLVEGQPDYSIFTVVGSPHDESAGGSAFWVIDVVYERSLEDTTEFSDGDICRLKILKPAAGGDTFFQMPTVLPYILRNINSTSQVSQDGEFVYYTSFLYYRKSAAGLIIPELKKGDEFRAVLQNGKTLILEVTGQGSFSSPFFVCPTRIVSQGVTLADSENYNVNFIYY